MVRRSQDSRCAYFSSANCHYTVNMLNVEGGGDRWKWRGKEHTFSLTHKITSPTRTLFSPRSIADPMTSNSRTSMRVASLIPSSVSGSQEERSRFGCDWEREVR